MMSVFIIGTGNLGTHLCKQLESVAHPAVRLVGYSNQSNHRIEGIHASLLQRPPSSCDLIILAVPDDVILPVSRQLDTTATVVHTSGSVPMSVLERHQDHGVFYIPQTFSEKREVDFSALTLCLESSSNDVMKQLEVVAGSLSRKRTHINSHQRQQLHLAAVYMNNFVNHCYLKAHEILEVAGIEADILEPLMNETLAKAQQLGAFEAQTGPARRGDVETLKRHLEQLLQKDRALYLAISESIKRTYET